MANRRAHVLIPEDLITDIDALVGPRQLNAYLIEVLREEVNRRRLLKMLSGPQPLLNHADYPEFKTAAMLGSGNRGKRIYNSNVRSLAHGLASELLSNSILPGN